MKSTARKFSVLPKAAALALGIIALGACEKDEIPVAPFERGEAVTAGVGMGPLYRDQVWYSLERNEVTAVNSINDWDIAFESAPESRGIFLNEAKLMHAWLSPHADLESAGDTAGYGQGKRVEAAARFHTDPAVEIPNHAEPVVYLIDLGFSHEGEIFGLIWLEITQTDGEGYTFRTKFFGENQITEQYASRDPERNLVRYSLRDATVPPTAPPDADWDIVFTKYTFSFDDPPIDYLVTGALLNPAGVMAAELSDMAFADITLGDLPDGALSPQLDVIGYNWKAYSFDTARYDVDSGRSFVVKSVGGLHYKIRFIDFYDDSGNVGAPKWEAVVI